MEDGSHFLYIVKQMSVMDRACVYTDVLITVPSVHQVVKTNVTEGYPCVHTRTIFLQTVRRYGTSQCGEDRDEFT